MKDNSMTFLSQKRISISLLIFIAIPGCAHLLNFLTDQYDIALMTCINTGCAVLLIYDWNLFCLHYNRARTELSDTFLSAMIVFILLLLWTWVSLRFLRCRIVLPSREILRAYGYARPGMYVAYSIMESAAFMIIGFCISSRLIIHHSEKQTILLTGLLSGFLITFVFLPGTEVRTILTTVLYNIGLMTLEASVSLKTDSFIAGMLGFAISNLVFMLF